MKALPQVKTTTDKVGRTLYWLRTDKLFPWCRIGKWWADVAIKNHMARKVE